MTTHSLTLIAPAKINLSLRILGKREDGYHEIETLMAPLALADEIELCHAHAAEPSSVTLLCSDPTLPTDVGNLCVKAAHAFQKALGIQEAVSISLLKKIPHGAGLGGGSSDAAAILRGMNTLFDEPFVFEELLQLGAALGSDVPFFIEAKSVWCRGRGELLSEAAPLPDWKLLLIKPPFAVASAEAYGRLKAGGWRLEEKKSVIIDDIKIFNDLEGPVFEKYLQLPILKSWLRERPEVATAWMTGSGSTMVAALQKEISIEEISKLQKNIAAEFGNSFWIKETRFA